MRMDPPRGKEGSNVAMDGSSILPCSAVWDGLAGQRASALSDVAWSGGAFFEFYKTGATYDFTQRTHPPCADLCYLLKASREKEGVNSTACN